MCSALVAAGSGNQLASTLIHQSNQRTDWSLYVPLCALIEAESQSYEHPSEVVKWFYMQPQRLSEMEGLALESNVVSWILSKEGAE